MCDEDFIPFSLPASVIPLLFSVGWKFNGSLWAVHIIKISFKLCGKDCGWEPHSKKERHKSYFLTRGFFVNHVWSRSPTIKRGTPRRDSNQGNQMWSIHVVFATDQHHISGEVLCFKFPAFVWIWGGENIASFWVQSFELNLHANDA